MIGRTLCERSFGKAQARRLPLRKERESAVDSEPPVSRIMLWASAGSQPGAGKAMESAEQILSQVAIAKPPLRHLPSSPRQPRLAPSTGDPLVAV